MSRKSHDMIATAGNKTILETCRHIRVSCLFIQKEMTTAQEM